MERKFWGKAVALGLLAIAILLIGGNFYLSRMKQSLWEQSVHNVLEVTAQGGKTFEAYIDQGKFMLGVRARNFAKNSSADAGAIGRKLDLYENGDPSFVVLDLSRDILYFNSRERTVISEDTANDYLALPKNGVLEPFISAYTGLRVVGYYERFIFADGAPGMVYKSVPLAEVARRFSLSFYDGAGYSYIVNAKGRIMFRSGSEGGNRTFQNIFDVVALDDNTKADADAFRAAMSGGKRGVMRLKFGGNDHIFAFVPLNVTDGWYLVSVIPDNVIMEHADRMMMSSQLMIGGIAAALLVFAAFILASIRHRQQMQAKETEVRYRDQLFSLLVNNTDNVFLMLAADRNTVEYVSPNVERVLGIDKAAVEKDVSCLQNVIHGIETEAAESDRLAVPLNGSAVFEGDYTHRSTNEKRWFLEHIYHTLIENIERYIVVLADRTDDRKKEAALTEALKIATVANKSKSAFLANMSHDIRTPMNAIVGLATLLQRDAEKPERVREHTEKITSSSQHLLGLINDVLDMSKIESGKTSLNVSDFSLAKLVEELDNIIRPQIKAKKQAFDITVQNVRHEILVGDKQRISQVMINILSNAVKYTADGGRIKFSVRQIGQTAPDIVRTRFIVADNGIGMSEEYQHEIFNPFTREVRTTVNRIQGTGLGMAITKNLVELMGGTITVKSKLGEGSTFTIDLDLRVRHQEDEAGFWQEHNIANALVVDDEADICTDILSAMTGTGVAMQVALDGATAVRMTQLANQSQRDFDLIIIDWKMPGMDGLETARRIRATVPARIPIMMLTAYDWDEIRDEGVAAGIDGFLPKPFFLSNLKEAIRSIHRREPAADSQSANKRIAGRHFLCAEDNELNAEILIELLDIEAASADVAVNGLEAVEKFAAAPAGTYDAILMDVQMPVLNGYEATRAIRALDHPQAATIPIVAMTANAFSDDVRDALEAGMNAHIAKPVDMEKLVEVLAMIQKKKR